MNVQIENAITPAVPQAASEPNRVLQRKCDCGNHAIGGGECEGCRQKSGDTLRRATAGSGGPSSAPPIVHEVLNSPGHSLSAETRSFFEPRFGHDFSSVRVHTNTRAAESARAVNAHAYTVGNNIVFGSGMYSPATERGAGLLAHELTHVAQQSNVDRSSSTLELGEANDSYERQADAHAAAVAVGDKPTSFAPLSSPRVQGSFVSGLLDVLLFIPRLFGLEVFPAEDLREYLADIRRRRGPAGGIFSDNKARACVSRENEFGPYDVQTKVFLIQEMLDGWTSFLDEGSIITLLRRSPSERAQIVSAVGRNHLWSKFDGSNRRIIEALTLTAADAGDALVSRLRNLTPGEIQDYATNATDPAIQESVRRAAALANITAPVPSSATITPAGHANFTINGVNVVVEPDRIVPAHGIHAYTRGTFQTSANAADPTVAGSTPQATITVTIWTEFPSEESKQRSSGYGVGTRPGDVSTLRFHERGHGEGWFRFFRENAPPAFAGTAGMDQAAFDAAFTQWRTAVQDYMRRAGAFALTAGDCVGRLPTDEQLAGTGYTASICQQAP
jgi:hypothetical protein